MRYYIILCIPFLLVMLRLAFTNHLIPYIKRKEQKNLLMQRNDWSHIKSKVTILENIYKNSSPKWLSIIYQVLRVNQNKELIYGEIDPLSFYTILERVSPTPEDIFYDLGSGAGKAVLSSALFFNVHKAIGLELLRPLHEHANAQRTKAIQHFEQSHVKKQYVSCMQRVQFIHGSFLHDNFSDATIIYVAATCLTDATWANLIVKMAKLKPGSHVIVATRTIHHHAFELVYHGIDLMSWGLCPVNIYKIRPLND
jgi:hypothetical protein